MEHPRTIKREPIYPHIKYGLFYRTLYSQYKDTGSIPVWTTKFTNMTYRQEKRIFYNWLRKKDLLEIYKKRHEEDPYQSNPKALRIGDNFIFQGLYWNGTPEGFNFWFHLDMKWRKHLNRKRKKYHSY